jgi:hypothetical protein
MARSAYKSAKRSKELLRQKKQEAKRLRRQGKDKPAEENQEPAAGEPTPQQGTSE